MRTTDNNGDGKPIEKMLEKNENYSFSDLKEIGNKTISELVKDNLNLLVFPQIWQLGIEKNDKIFDLSDNGILTTNNIMGFIGCGETKLTISSRFYHKDNDYFLYYMLAKVLGINVVNLDPGKGENNINDFLSFLFPSYLQDALSQGVFKQYKRSQYNDSNVKGVIDINRHIKLNIPFVGKIAYTMREHSRDNSMTQLIRHTIEHLRTRPFGHNILTNNADIRANVSQIEYVTPLYKRSNLQKVIRANLQPVNHPYFVKYRNLQKLCLMILRRDNTNFGNSNDKIHGLLFDGAWLWEEYINCIIGDKFWHPRNKTKTNSQKLFDNFKEDKEEGWIYPDFISKDVKSRIIADAKYKPVGNIKGDDYLQLLAYMYRFDSKKGFYIYPKEHNDKETKNNSSVSYKLLQGATFDGKDESKERAFEIIITKFGLKIPQSADKFIYFCEKMKENEEHLKKAIL